MEGLCQYLGVGGFPFVIAVMEAIVKLLREIFYPKSFLNSFRPRTDVEDYRTKAQIIGAVYVGTPPGVGEIMLGKVVC